MPGNQVFTGMIFKILHHAAYRVTVNMHIYRRHKYRYLYAFILQVFSFGGFFNYYHFTISRAKHLCFVFIYRDERAAEELQYDHKKHKRYDVDEPLQAMRQWQVKMYSRV